MRASFSAFAGTASASAITANVTAVDGVRVDVLSEYAFKCVLCAAHSPSEITIQASKCISGSDEWCDEHFPS